MTLLENFRRSDFAEQITILSQIQADNLTEAIPDLFDLFRQPLQDTMVDHMVITGLQSLLACDEHETVLKIKNGNMKEKALCINIAGIHHFASAIPVLHGLLHNDTLKELHAESFLALAEIKSPQSLSLFREYIHHFDEVLASVAVQMVGQYRDEDSIETLLVFIEQAEKMEAYETCSLKTGMAIEALATIKTTKSISYLVSSIHHRNATTRRIIHDALVKTGSAAVPLLATIFDGNDTDGKILAANILGLIGHKLGGEVMVRALDAEQANDPNVRYAIYEAFGRIPFLKGLTCLVDALQSDDDLILMAVLTALENQVNSGVIARLKEIIDEGGAHRDKIIRALVSVKAVHLFKNLYADKKIAQVMMAEIAQTGDPDVVAAFKTALAMMEGAAPKADLAKLSSVVVTRADRFALVVDDSKAMLSFYKSVASDLQLKIQTAGNGREALDLMEIGQSFDLIITDMNMPVMDGLELTRKIRQQIGDTKIPIIMVTTESEQAQRNMARSAGVDTFITKPFTAAALKEALQLLLKV